MLESTNVKEQFLITGSTNAFDFGVRFFGPEDISCYVYNPTTGAEVQLTSGTDFSVEQKEDYSSGAKVTLQGGALTSGNILTIVRAVVPKQNVSLPNFGKIPSESLETQLDRTEAVVQQLHDAATMMFKMPYGASGTESPEDAIRNLVSSGGGGGGGGDSYNFNPLEFNVTSGGSVSINAVDKSKITGLASALDGKQDKLTSGGSYHVNVDSAMVAGALANGAVVNSATNATNAGSAAQASSASVAGYATTANYASSAGIASALTSDAKEDILDSAGGMTYAGPFAAIVTAYDGDATTTKIINNATGNSDYAGSVSAGGSVWNIPNSSGIQTYGGEIIYLHGNKTPYGSSFEFVTSSGLNTSNDIYTPIAYDQGSGVMKQVQYGDVFAPSWEETSSSGGGGGTNIEVISKSWNVAGTFSSATTDGLIMAQVVMGPSSTVGQMAWVNVGGSAGKTYAFAQVPQNTVNGGCFGCTCQVPVHSGDTWQAVNQIDDADSQAQLYFMKFNS